MLVGVQGQDLHVGTQGLDLPRLNVVQRLYVFFWHLRRSRPCASLDAADCCVMREPTQGIALELTLVRFKLVGYRCLFACFRMGALKQNEAAVVELEAAVVEQNNKKQP